jgi:hypothetical protein
MPGRLKSRCFMEVRFMGFDQQQNARVYRFEVLEKGQTPRRFTVTADLSLFLTHRVGIQEGPVLCANKLSADLEKNLEGAHELTGDDLRSHAAARTEAEAHRAEMRRNGARRRTPSAAAEAASPWRNTGF